MYGFDRIGRGMAGLCLATGLASTAGASDGVVGPGNCNEAGFSSVLAAVDGSGGGTLTFQCGTATIPITSYKRIASAVTIDGGGTITLDGGNASPLMQVFASANVTLRGMVLRRGVLGDTHAIENFGHLALDRVRVADNVSGGAAVQNYGTLVVRNSTFSGNRNTATGGDGGAIAHEGDGLDVRMSTFSGNEATRHGGAIFSAATLLVVNSTFTANKAFGGGAMYQAGFGDSRIEYATIAGNTGTVFGGGIYNEGSADSTLRVARSILSANAGGNCDGELLSGGYNLWSGVNCALTSPGDGAGTPALGTLASNGGPTQTMLPGAGSSAIDRIPLAQCSVGIDQRGGGRPAGSGCDSGAVEVGAAIDVIFQDGFDG